MRLFSFFFAAVMLFLDNLYLLKTIGAVTLGAMPYNPTDCIQQPDEKQLQTAKWNARTGNTGQPHAMVITGYDNNKQAFKIMNSWSTGWGDKGFAWIDYEFFHSNAHELGYVLY